MDLNTWSKLGDRNLKEGQVINSNQERVDVRIVRHFDPVHRDKMVAIYRSEPHDIDAALEVVNAVTDLIEERAR
jgi:hypothetical protein